MEGYTHDRTGLLLLDPYNDFLSEDGKLWPFTKEVAESVDLLAHLREIVGTRRNSVRREFMSTLQGCRR